MAAIEQSGQIIEIIVPENVQPGMFFNPTIGVRVRCPLESRPGDKLKIRMPVPIRMFRVIVPEGVPDGGAFRAKLEENWHVKVVAPKRIRPGMSVGIWIPTHVLEAKVPEAKLIKAKMQWVEAVVPYSAQKENQPFLVKVSGIHVLVQCPSKDAAGKKIRFQWPEALLVKTPPSKAAPATNRPALAWYGWTRILQVGFNDRIFRWVRVSGTTRKINIPEVEDFHPFRSAFLRRIQPPPQESDAARTSKKKGAFLKLVPAVGSMMPSSITDATSATKIASYADILSMQNNSNMKKKREWFQDLCLRSFQDGERECRIRIRRSHLLEDSVEAILSLSDRSELHMTWKAEFVREAGAESSSGTATREWFELLLGELLDPVSSGLWQPTAAAGGGGYEPNSAAVDDDSLDRLCVVGRVMGKALSQGIPVLRRNEKLAGYLYSYLSGWPLTMVDIKAVDVGLYNSLVYFQTLLEQNELNKFLETMTPALTFTLPQTSPDDGVTRTVPLLQEDDAANKRVTEENFPIYMEKVCQWLLLERIRPQLQALVAGFSDVIPEQVLHVLRPRELEWFLRGLPALDNNDEWISRTAYKGKYEDLGLMHPQIQWFWAIVAEMDYATKICLLQFITGLSPEEIYAFWG
jgi:hypothetical protein